MENNRYAHNKAEVAKISDERNVDISVACAILREEKGWRFEETEGIDKEITAFCDFINQMDGDEVAKYFAE